MAASQTSVSGKYKSTPIRVLVVLSLNAELDDNGYRITVLGLRNI
jgi:hypothetical protein